MRIIIFDGTFKTTTFIQRLAKGLSKRHDIYILGFNENIGASIDNISYIGLGSNSSLFIFLKRRIVLRKLNLLKQFELLNLLIKGNKKQIKALNLQLAIDKIQPDIIHFQWVSVLSYLEKLQLPSFTKTVLSQRGFHINVRPFIDQENMQFLKGVFPKIDGFHSVSQAIREKSNEIYSSASKIDQVVYSGFDYADLPVKENSEFSNVLQILSVGRNHWKKDYKTSLNAMSILKTKKIAFHYTIVGVDKDEELLFLVSDLGLMEYVSFIPTLSQQGVYQKMIASDLLLLPSIEEGIANVCIEAMFCKLPVLSTNCGGMEELIEEEETGFLVPIRSPEEMAIKILKIKKKESEELYKITNKAREKVIVIHSAKNMILDMEKLYNTIKKNNSNA